MKLLAGLIFCTSVAVGQNDSLNFSPRPHVDPWDIRLLYFRIKFTDEQKTLLSSRETEFTFKVNDQGVANLDKITGVFADDVIDSLRRIDYKLPSFYPETVDGKPRASTYLLVLHWPAWLDEKLVESLKDPKRQKRGGHSAHKRKEYESIEFSQQRFDLSIGGFANEFVGSSSDYLKSGPGMRVDMLRYNKNGWGRGLTINVTYQERKMDYPVATAMPQLKQTTLIFFGIPFGKTWPETNLGLLGLQLQANAVHQFVAPADNDLKESQAFDIIGFSPAFLCSYSFRIGPGKMIFNQFNYSFMQNYLDLHVGIRPMFYNKLKEASGVALEAGLSFHLAYREVKSFKMRSGL